MKAIDTVRRWFGRDQRNINGDKPITLADLVALSSTGDTYTTKTVTQQNALTLVAVYASVRILSETVASLPLVVYERLDRGKRKAHTHPVYRLLHDTANPEMTAAVFKETMQGHLALWGNAYARIEFDGDGNPVALWPLLPDRTSLVTDGKTKRYETTVNGQRFFLYPDEVLHIPAYGFDGYSGYSPIAMARNAIAVGMSAEEFGGKLFANGAVPGGVLQHPGKLSKEALEHLRESWTDVHGGVGNAHKPAILEEGMTWTSVSIPSKDAQFLECRKFQISEIARLYRIPPHLLADLDRATFSNIEQQSLEFIQYTMTPWLVKWEQEVNRKLFLKGQPYFAEFLTDALVRGDISTRYQAYATARQWGWLSINDIRERENLNPIEGGDVYLSPLNMTNAQTTTPLAPATPTKDVPQGQRQAVVAVLADALSRVSRKATDRRAAAKDSAGWAASYYQTERESIARTLTPAVAVAARLFNPAVTDATVIGIVASAVNLSLVESLSNPTADVASIADTITNSIQEQCK